MAPKKPSRQQYLKQQVATAKAAGASAQVISNLNKQITQAGKNIQRGGVDTPGTLEYIDNQINQLLYGVSGSGEGGIAGTAAPEYKPPTGTTGSTTTTVPNPYAEEMAAQRRDAYALLQQTFSQYGLDSLVGEIQNYMKQNLGPEEASLNLTQSEAYKQRFIGNQGRIAKGLSAYSPKEYLQAEEIYANLLKSNGLDALANRDVTSTLIGGAVSPEEAQARIAGVFKKIDNADAATKTQLKQYFGQYGVGDETKQRTEIATALLTGDTQAINLKRNLEKAYLRAGAETAGVKNISEVNVEELQKQLETAGVSDTYSAAKQGFSTIAQLQPLSEKLSQIYQEAPITDQELQQEAFFGLKSQKRAALQEKEKAAFRGQTGVSKVSLDTSTAGQI
jgi:hypothetical protein